MRDQATMKSFPDNVLPYKKTPEFTERTLPDAVRESHRTKEGVWAKIIVLEGSLEYSILQGEIEVVPLKHGVVGVVEPAIHHCVKPIGAVRFYVEFYK